MMNGRLLWVKLWLVQPVGSCSVGEAGWCSGSLQMAGDGAALIACQEKSADVLPVNTGGESVVRQGAEAQVTSVMLGQGAEAQVTSV